MTPAAPWSPTVHQEVAATARLDAPAPARSPPRRSSSVGVGFPTRRIRGSYRYLRYGLQPTPALQRRESRHHRELDGLDSRASSSASRVVPPPCRLNFGAPRVDDNEATSSLRPHPVPQFDPGDFVPYDQIPMVAVALERNAPALTTGDFVHESALGTVTALMEEKTRHEAEKAAEWCREQEAYDAKLVELSDSDESD